jgi:uncharacterized RDD family membrane protein YckC
MTCTYCGSQNSDTEHRCRRCGRRPEDTLNGEFPVHRTAGNLATKLATKPRPTEIDPPPEKRASNPASNQEVPVQGSLFTANVIAMPSRGARPGKTGTRSKAMAQEPAGGKTPRRVLRGRAENQSELDFLEPALAKPKTLATTVDAVVYCEAQVATPMHRALAAAIDWTMVMFGYGLFLLTFAKCGGEFVINRPNLLIFGGALVLIGCTYGLLWTIAGTETAGMRWTHLRLTTFDGFPPDIWQRAARSAFTCLSFFSVLGVLWSLADEEGLGWQDHMSRSFPTPHEMESRVFRRR